MQLRQTVKNSTWVDETRCGCVWMQMRLEVFMRQRTHSFLPILKAASCPLFLIFHLFPCKIWGAAFEYTSLRLFYHTRHMAFALWRHLPQILFFWPSCKYMLKLFFSKHIWKAIRYFSTRMDSYQYFSAPVAFPTLSPMKLEILLCNNLNFIVSGYVFLSG